MQYFFLFNVLRWRVAALWGALFLVFLGDDFFCILPVDIVESGVYTNAPFDRKFEVVAKLISKKNALLWFEIVNRFFWHHIALSGAGKGTHIIMRTSTARTSAIEARSPSGA
ncbi:MAG: hypothetical protein SFW63_05780 [Alphaproteobacteria bacterium]|nr:hypothetical protein [Alphaproteobacteria bacterium]